MQKNSHKKRMKGTVVSNKMQKTVVVLVSRYKKHPKYGKYERITKRYKAHDEKNEYLPGDRVVIESTRPMSKGKHFVVVSKI